MVYLMFEINSSVGRIKRYYLKLQTTNSLFFQFYQLVLTRSAEGTKIQAQSFDKLKVAYCDLSTSIYETFMTDNSEVKWLCTTGHGRGKKFTKALVSADPAKLITFISFSCLCTISLVFSKLQTVAG